MVDLQHPCRVLSSPSVGVFPDVLIGMFTGICKKQKNWWNEMGKVSLTLVAECLKFDDCEVRSKEFSCKTNKFGCIASMRTGWASNQTREQSSRNTRSVGKGIIGQSSCAFDCFISSKGGLILAIPFGPFVAAERCCRVSWSQMFVNQFVIALTSAPWIMASSFDTSRHKGGG